MHKNLIAIGIFVGFEIIKALCMMILWNMSVPNIFENVSEITWLESFCILSICNILSKTSIKIANKD